jgi:RNA recognition motif-containing protein
MHFRTRIIPEAAMNIFTGNLPREFTEEGLRELFQKYGQVRTVTIIRDRYTNLSRGFGFCEMPVQTEAEAAIVGLDGMEINGRFLDVSIAVPRKSTHGKGGKEKKPDLSWRFKYLR